MESQLSAPTIVKISAITENTLKVFFKLFSLLVSCRDSMREKGANIRFGNIFDDTYCKNCFFVAAVCQKSASTLCVEVA